VPYPLHVKWTKLLLASLVFAGAGLAHAQEYVPGEILVKLKGKSSSSSNSQFFGKLQGKLSLKASFSAMNIHRLSLKGNGDVLATVQELKADPAVEYAEPNYILRKVDEDSLASSQSLSLDEVREQMQAGDTYVQNYANVGVEQAWPLEATLVQVPEKPIVAIIDTGVDYNHVVFHDSNAMWRNTGEVAGNGVDDDGNGYVDDIYGWNFHGKNNNPMDDDEHGTHVAGIVLGVGQDIFPTTWEPAKVRIMALKFLGADGSGSTSDAVAAMYYAVNNGAQVINNSWGGSSYSQALHDALTYAYDRKVVIVSAAGNYGKNNDSVNMYPANYPVPGQISVAATTDADNLASFSNYGASRVHVAAPGVSILSSVPGDQYRFMSGTSMASPFVSGLAAMVLREAPNLTGYQIKNLILNSATQINGLSTKIYSKGRADAYDAISAARLQSSTASYQPEYKAESRSPASATEEEAQSGPKGCGTVTTALLYGRGGGDGGQGPMSTRMLMTLVALTLCPLIVWQVMRLRPSKVQRRRYDRFLMNSAIRLNVDGRELVGHMRTISEGGLSFEANTMLEKGGILTMSIQSPDGKESVQVEGHIVWSEENKSYGVQFDQARDGVLSSIRGWTRKLVRVANY
jgi:subtilisin family serine protease